MAGSHSQVRVIGGGGGGGLGREGCVQSTSVSVCATAHTMSAQGATTQYM